MKNYYEILEIDQKASQEIVEKAYKVLIKKYHPDLQSEPKEKIKCEEKIKEINEAYDTISNSQLRAEYDNKLVEEYNKLHKNQQFNQSQHQQQNYSTEPQHYYSNVQQTGQARQAQQAQQAQQNQQARQAQQAQQAYYQEELKRQAQYQQQYRDAINKAYHDAYIQDLKNRGYKIRYKKTFGDYIRSLISILITIGIIFLIVQLPFVKNWLYELYMNNVVIKSIVDTFINIFK